MDDSDIEDGIEVEKRPRPDDELYVGNDNPLYESRDYGVKLHIDTLSAAVVVEPIEDMDSKNGSQI